MNGHSSQNALLQYLMENATFKEQNTKMRRKMLKMEQKSKEVEE